MSAYRILMVEDETSIAALLRMSLMQLGYHVQDAVRTGEGAIERAAETKPDLVLMDIELAGELDGIEAAEHIRTVLNIPVVYLSGYGDEARLKKAKLTEPYGYLMKPVLKEELRAAVEIALHKHRQEKLLREELETTVEQRTSQLLQANEKLAQEISERTRVEKELQLKNEFLSTVLESLTHPFYVIDVNDYNVIIANSAANLDISAERSTCYQLTHGRNGPCDTEEHHCPLEEVKSTRGPVSVQHVHVDREGNARHVEVHAYPVLDDHGDVAKVIEYAMDVTDRVRAVQQLRESEERFRTVFERAQDCMFIKDSSLRYTHVNPSMQYLLDRRAEQMIGLTEQEVFQDESAEYVEHVVDARVLKGETVEAERTRLVNDIPIALHEVRMPMFDKSGKNIGLFGIARNVTERKKIRSGDRPVLLVKYGSEAMRRALTDGRLAASTDSIVLLTGESGTGKDYMAGLIHDLSKRGGGPFFAINCAAVAPELAESELFGHERGAFTGANRIKRGLLELAEGGTLLLNEIGELSLSLQAKLLSFLDTRRFTRVGGEREISVDARLIAATNRDLKEAVSIGRFRQDLFYRLNVFAIKLPSLRDRIEDLPVLVKEILIELAAELQLDTFPSLAPESFVNLSRYAWPGNVRELRNVLERALIISDHGSIEPTSLGLPSDRKHWSHTVYFPEGRSLKDVSRELEGEIVAEALRRCDGRKRAAARLLQISRDTLYRCIDRYRGGGLKM